MISNLPRRPGRAPGDKSLKGIGELCDNLRQILRSRGLAAIHHPALVTRLSWGVVKLWRHVTPTEDLSNIFRVAPFSEDENGTMVCELIG